jgi:hypothetical protein
MLTKMKKRSALLVTLAVLCASVAVAPQMASAQSKVPNAGTATDPHTAPNETTAMTACPGSSAPAAGFSDTTATDVDCIKMFGITQGTSATTYEPAASIPRWQMALFIHRMFVPTGLAAAGTTTVPAFTDTADLSAEIQAAITALASHGITVGTTATTFGPNDNVTREQMALFLYRFGKKIKPFDTATDVTGIFDNAAADIASGSYNFSDIAGATFEGMEAIIAMYNIGATAEACTATTIAANPAACATTYRPNADITRAEMATMIKAVLDLSNARPAGATIQTTTAVTATTEATAISYRNADFTPAVNTIVDGFQHVVNDTSATTQAASVPFNVLSGLCNTGAGGVAGTGTTCVLDTADKATNSLGNVAGASQALTANSTGKWWVWTGAQGDQYINGTTSTGFLFEAVVTTAAGSTYATTATHALSNTNAVAINLSAGPVTANDSAMAFAGTSETITTTLTGASSAAVVDGYTVKYVDKVINYGSGTGNISTTFNTSYVPTSGGVASYTITCAADPVPLASNAKAAVGAAAAEYWESHEVTITFATATGNGWPALGSDPTDAGLMNNSTMNVICDDEVRDYVGGTNAETLSVNQNYASVSTAGTLATITATAYDQYGDGIAGVEASFTSVTKSNTALTAEATGGAAPRGTLFTGSDGTASLSAVVCDSASVITSGSVAFAIADPGANANEMDTVAIATPTNLVEGTTIYCAKTGTDTMSETAMNMDVPTSNETFTIAFTEDGAGAADPKTGGKFTVTIGDATSCGATFTTGEIDGDATSADIVTAIEALTCVTDVTVTAAGTTWTSVVVAHLANTGNWPDAVVTEGTGGKALVKHGGGDEAMSLAVTSSQGTYGTTFDFVDNNTADDSITTVRTVKERTAAGAAVVTTSYDKWVYDSTDVFEIQGTPGTPGATEAQFETEMATKTAQSDSMAITYRTGALTTGISAFLIVD